MTARQRHLFGGDWTKQKLDMLGAYLRAYVTAMKRQRFRLMYIDAFAGTGYWRPAPRDPIGNLLFPEIAEEETSQFMAGSARRALNVQPPFDCYVFIESSQQNVEQLQALVGARPDLAGRVEIVQGDCNEHLPVICKETDWRRSRAVLFLDPFAMELEWHVLEAVAATRAIDTWLLWPVMAMNRMLAQHGRISLEWRERLDRFLGTSEWYNAFYRVHKGTDLYGQDVEAITKVVDFGALRRYLNERLGSVFAAVADNPRLLLNSRDSPLFLLCFAMANPAPKAVALAKKIAEHILGE